MVSSGSAGLGGAQKTGGVLERTDPAPTISSAATANTQVRVRIDLSRKSILYFHVPQWEQYTTATSLVSGFSYAFFPCCMDPIRISLRASLFSSFEAAYF